VTTVTVSGASTPYVDQFSYQQSLVMQGKVDEALASFESIITENPHRVDAHMRAGELYAAQKGNPRRAAELFRSAQAIPTISAGEDVYVTNRLVDLYTGPLGTPGRALIELRRLIDRYPGTVPASYARAALSKIKKEMHAAG
jgi:TolA-binding protein